MLSEHAHCPENYVKQVLDARNELPESEEAFNASQMNTNLQNMFAIDAAAADGFELDISGNLLSFLLRCGTRPYERGTQ